MKRILLWSSRLAFGAAAALLVIAFGIDRLLARDVLLIAPHDESTVKLNRSLYAEGDPVAEIYGNPMSKPVRVVILDGDRIVRPAEDPSQLLLPVNAARGDHPLQVQTVWFATRYSVALLLAVAAVSALTHARISK
jgi:hypothetical protein